MADERGHTDGKASGVRSGALTALLQELAAAPAVAGGGGRP